MALTAVPSVGGWDTHRLSPAVALTALATRGQQAPTGSPSRVWLLG